VPHVFDAAPAVDVVSVALKPSTLSWNVDDARRQRDRAADAREAGDWRTEVADATSCFEQVAFALDEVAAILGATGQNSGHPAQTPVWSANGCIFNGCTKIKRGDWVASVVAYELGEPHGTWQSELHNLFTHFRHPNVHGGLGFATPVTHPAGPNLHPVYAAANKEQAAVYVDLLEEIVRRLGSKLLGVRSI